MHNDEREAQMGGKNVNLDFSIESVWEKIRDLRETVNLAMEQFGRDTREAAMMTATELVENAVKHSASHNAGIRFHLEADRNKIVITVTNKVRSEQDIRFFEHNVKQIKESDNPMDLYVHRLMELGDDPCESFTRLGLYRIAYEGEYEIDYKLQDGFLTVMASSSVCG